MGVFLMGRMGATADDRPATAAAWASNSTMERDTITVFMAAVTLARRGRSLERDSMAPETAV